MAALTVAATWSAAPRSAAAPPPATAREPAPVDDRPLDARMYAQGIEAARQGRRDEAYKTLRRVFQDFPDSPHAPPAILKVADLLYPVNALDQIGNAAPPAIKEATELLTLLSQKYRSTREAPRALVRLGYLALEPANAKVDLDAACGRFATAAQVYPDSDAADDAYFGSGVCESLRARDARAADVFGRLLDESPGSPLAAEALYRMGLALSHLEDPPEAMLALQQVRTRFPESPWAARALNRITLIHRLRLQPLLLAARAAGGAKPGQGEVAYQVDAAYGVAQAGRGREALAAAGGAAAPSSFNGASDLAIDPQGLALVASPKSPGVFRLDARGRVQERIPHPGPEFVAAGEGLAVFISGRDQIALNTRNWSGVDLKSWDGRPPRSFGPVALDSLGRVHLIDSRDNVLLIYDPSRRHVGTVRPGGKDGRFLDVAAGEDGGVYLLEGKSNAVIELHQGKEVRRVSLVPLGVGEPVALAADGLGDLYVLDGKTGWIYVADPSGVRLSVIRPPKEVLSRLGEATAVAVDPVGRVYLGGRKGGQVVRFQ
jgi:TolA-binding protein